MNDQIDPATLGLGQPQDRPRTHTVEIDLRALTSGERSAFFATMTPRELDGALHFLADQAPDSVDEAIAIVRSLRANEPYIPRRGDAVEAWLTKRHLSNGHQRQGIWRALAEYQRHADAGIPLDQAIPDPGGA
ncbi:hypothetical protein DQ384_26055 [Sphaerisporangium album]|uniref:Uncharacterized protein n=1 Tax=Sphaerisporangium album TaxID=509200 RepID=A0A367F9X6_9ACTN|nr:hypothetical protein [Sphaerisporangium album]RCG27186.1 hypothetical protein DQ384_26055 [Sphaerisporangium album]